MILLFPLGENEVIEVMKVQAVETVEEEIDWTPERIEQEVRNVFPEDPDVAVAIAIAESQLNPTVPNWKDSHKTCKGSFGIFQVACLHTDDYTKLYDVQYNLQMARKIYDQRGWQPWGAYTDGRYKQYLQ